MKKILVTIIVVFLSMNLFSQVTREEFFTVCDSLNIHHPYVVWAQARLESGNFKSLNFKTKNNCLGIYDSKLKCYASFKTWRDCLLAYRTRFQYKCENPDCTDEEYLTWLTSAGYAEDNSYYTKVLQIVNQEKQ